MDRITRRGLGALGFAALANEAFAKAPAVRSPWPDAVETAARIKAGKVSATEVVTAAIDKTLKLQPLLNFVVASDFDRALAKAKAGGQTGPFAGVPFFVKDLNPYVGLPTRSGSRSGLPLPPERRQTPYIDTFDKAGLIVIGKASTPEFGFLPTTEPTAFGPTRNPWDPSRSSGGSSGGAGVAVSAGVTPIAHANDGGGSIRIPASCCGVFGLKPSRGRMIGSRGDHEITDLGVDHILSRSIRDSAVMFAASEDPGPGAQHPPVGLVTQPLKRKLRVGLLIEGGAGHAPSPEVRTATENAAKLLQSLGHTVVPTTWPSHRTFINDFLLVWAGGAKAIHDSIQRFSKTPLDNTILENFSLGMVEMSRKTSPEQMAAAMERLKTAAQAYDPWFVKNRFDVVLSPVLATAAPPIGYVGPDVPFDTLVQRLIEYVGYTTYHNVVGAPAMSVPLNWTPGGLPVGSQFWGRVGDEGLLFQLAYQLEAAQPWADRIPPIVRG
jgi:amidase